MIMKLGKRKRENTVGPDDSPVCSLSEESTGLSEGYEDVFRRHFEARYQPLAESRENRSAQRSKPELEELRPDAEGQPSDWSGFSSEHEDEIPIVYHDKLPQQEKPSKSESRSFMVRSRMSHCKNSL